MNKTTCMLMVGLALGAQAGEMKIERLAPDIVRVRETRKGRLPSSRMNRYGILETLAPETVAELPDGFAMPAVEQTAKGFRLSFPLAKDAAALMVKGHEFALVEFSL